MTEKPAITDYRHCIDCNTTFDFWKYDSLADTGHEDHNLRMLTHEEYEEALKECGEEECF